MAEQNFNPDQVFPGPEIKALKERIGAELEREPVSPERQEEGIKKEIKSYLKEIQQAQGEATP